MHYISVKEYAEQAGISERTVQRQITAGKHQVKVVPHPFRKDQTSFLVFAPSAVPSLADSPNLSGDMSGDTIHDLAPADHLPLHRLSEAQLFAQYLEAAEAILDSATEKGEAWIQITRQYNARTLAPDLFRLKGKRSERTLRSWMTKWLESDRDMFALVHQNTSAQRGRKVTQFEQDYLLSLLLDGPKVSIGSAIAQLKHDARMGFCESTSSDSTLKRWVQDWSQANPDEWAQARHGSKYVKDNIVKSITRDTSMLVPGDILVADGHTFAFDIINPQTGKPARLTQILIYDWASRYPLGGSFALSESRITLNLYEGTSSDENIAELPELPALRFESFEDSSELLISLGHELLLRVNHGREVHLCNGNLSTVNSDSYLYEYCGRLIQLTRESVGWTILIRET